MEAVKDTDKPRLLNLVWRVERTILAAGLSSRMGVYKMTLDLGGKPVLAQENFVLTCGYLAQAIVEDSTSTSLREFIASRGFEKISIWSTGRTVEVFFSLQLFFVLFSFQKVPIY